MATTFTIPLTTLPVGSRDLGPSHPADSETAIVLTIDRTVTGGLNSLTSDSAIAMDVMQSNDGGNTWVLAVGSTFVGGLIPAGKGGGNVLQAVAKVDLTPGTSRQLKASVTVSGPSSIAVAGTLTTT